jgi:hypothetical protein
MSLNLGAFSRIHAKWLAHSHDVPIIMVSLVNIFINLYVFMIPLYYGLRLASTTILKKISRYNLGAANDSCKNGAKIRRWHGGATML